VQGDERVILEFAPVMRGDDAGDAPGQQSFRLTPTPEYVQMELSALDAADAEQPAAEGSAGD